MDERSKSFYAKVAKYGGWQQVPSEHIRQIFADTLKPEKMGFALVRPNLWARLVNPDIFHLIRMDALKGGGRGISYGLSLSFVPHPYLPKVTWHKTLKSVSFDLREQPQVHLLDSARAAGRTEDLVAGTMLGEKCFQDELENIWRFCSPRIAQWFDSTRDLPGVLAKCDDHLRQRRLGEIQYVPDERLVRAFTHVKMGRFDEAKQDLDAFLDEQQEGSVSRANLYTAFETLKVQLMGQA